MGEAIVITSGKGGVGKTTTCANLGHALASRGKRVALVDTDLGLRNLDLVLGLENRIKYDITHVIKKECELRQALIKDKTYATLVLLAASQTKNKEEINTFEVQKIIEELLKDYEFVLIDSPAGIDRGFRNAVAGVHSAIIITTPEIPAVRDADRTIGVLDDLNIRSRIIVNKVRSNMIKKGEMLDLDDILNILSAPLLGVVPDDDSIIASTNKLSPGLSLNPKAQSSLAYNNIARRILGEQVDLLNIKPPSKWTRLKAALFA